MILNNLTADKRYKNIFFEKMIEVAAKETGLGYKKIELSINLTGEGRIKTLNNKYRGKNKTTDVLSFPINKRVDVKSAGGDIISLGDIFICLPVAKKDAEQEDITLDHKLAFLTIHSFLHLLGYDHKKPEELNVMFQLQDKILNKMGFSS